MKTELVLGSIEMALWSRGLPGKGAARGLIHHSDRGSQCTSFTFTRRLVEAGVDASVGSVGDGYDNALAESTIGLYKAEVINRRRIWKTFSEVELATSEWIDWYNHRASTAAVGTSHLRPTSPRLPLTRGLPRHPQRHLLDGPKNGRAESHEEARNAVLE